MLKDSDNLREGICIIQINKCCSEYVRNSYMSMKRDNPVEKKMDRRYEGAVYRRGTLGSLQTGCLAVPRSTAVRHDFSSVISSVTWTLLLRCERKWHSHMPLRERGIVNCHNHFREHLVVLVKWKMLMFCGPASPCLWISLENCCMCTLKSRLIITPTFNKGERLEIVEMFACMNHPYLCDL